MTNRNTGDVQRRAAAAQDVPAETEEAVDENESRPELPPGVQTQNQDIAQDIATRRRTEQRDRAARIAADQTWQNPVLPSQFGGAPSPQSMTFAGQAIDSPPRTVDATKSEIQGPESGSFAVGNAELRQSAIWSVKAAIEVLDGLEDGTIDADMAKMVIVPHLQKAVMALELRSSSLDELAEARASIRVAESLLQRATEFFRRHGPPAVRAAVWAAAIELAKVLIGL
jgi:hypothetical protein